MVPGQVAHWNRRQNEDKKKTGFTFAVFLASPQVSFLDFLTVKVAKNTLNSLQRAKRDCTRDAIWKKQHEIHGRQNEVDGQNKGGQQTICIKKGNTK